MKEKIQVIHSNGCKKNFKPRLISQQIKKETNVSDELADKIQRRVSNQLYKLNVDEISTSLIRSQVSSQLLKEGMVDDAEKSRKMGMNYLEIEDLLKNHSTENANNNDNSESFYKRVAEKTLEEYTFNKLPKHISEAHRSGFIHLHDRADFFVKPNCFSYSLQWLLKNGFSPDGEMRLGAVSESPKHFDTLMNLIHELLGCGKIHLSGGQGFPHLNTLLSVCSVDLTYKELKQSLQSLLFNLNQAIMSKGEVVFSSLGFDLEVPSYMKNEPAIGLGGVTKGVYGDYNEEVKRILKIWCELLKEGDALGRPFRFPNNLFNLRDDYENNVDEQLYWICDYLCKFPTGYFVNDDLENTGGISSVMGALSSDTPVMTDEGFKYPHELEVGDNVMTYSKDGSKKWNKIYNVIKKQAPDKIFKITCDNGYMFKITDNHKLPTSEGIIKSENLKVGMELYNYVDEYYEPNDDYEAEFIGVFLADGFIKHKPRHQRNGNNIEFHIRKEWKANEIIKLCSELNYDYEFITCKDGSYKVLVKEKELRDELVKLYDDCLGVKRFPNEYWNDKNKLANIIKGLMFDGRKGSKTRWVWSCSNKELVYDFCYAISLLGLKSTIYEDTRKGSTSNWKTNYIVSFGKNYNPKNTTTIKSIELVSNRELVYDLSIEENHNYVCGLGGIHSQNCRTRSTNADTRYNWVDNTMNTGNLAFHSLNLPLLALESNSLEEFYTLLEKYTNICLESLFIRRKAIEKRLNDGKLSFLTWKDKQTRRTLYEIDRTTLSVGYVGLNECIRELSNDDYDITTSDGIKLGKNIINFIQKIIDKEVKKTGYKIGVFSTPAESTAGRFARINKAKYPNAKVCGSGDEIYYTNSHHIDVGKEIPLTHVLNNADEFHKLTPFGAICHVFLGEKPDINSLIKLTKMIKKKNIGFWSYTLDFSVCETCGHTVLKSVEKCPNCGSKHIIVYSKITGYYVPVKKINNEEVHYQWNKGKLGEFKDRNRYILEDESNDN